MTETSNESIERSPDTINVLPILSEAKAPISLTLTVDKSVGKVAAWVIGLIVANSLLLGIAIVMAFWMTSAYRETEREVRLQRLEVDEMKVALQVQGIKVHEGSSP